MKPFISTVIKNRLYRLKLTLGIIVEYEQLTESKIVEIDFFNPNHAENVMTLMWLMIRRENQGITLKKVIEDIGGQSIEDRVEILKAMQTAVLESYPKPEGEASSEPQYFNIESCMQIASRLGLNVWEMTPGEYTQAQKEYIKKREQEINDIMLLAWKTANLTRAKHMPQLQSLFVKLEKPKKQTDDDMMNACKNIALAFGGKVVEV